MKSCICRLVAFFEESKATLSNVNSEEGGKERKKERNKLRK